MMKMYQNLAGLYDMFINMSGPPVAEKIKINEHGISLIPADDIDPKYLEKWNATHTTDFVYIAKNGIPLRKTLYRVGGLGDGNIINKNYFTLLKYVEEFYEDNVTVDPKRKQHLASYTCIIDQHGEEKAVSNGSYTYIYLIDNTMIYSSDQKYYNCETGEFYCYANSMMTSSDYIFLEAGYGVEEDKKGIWRINKNDGSYIIYK